MDIDSNPGLTSSRGLDHLADTNSLAIRRNQNLESVAGLEALVHAGYRNVSRNDALVSLSGLESLKTVDRGVVIRDNPRLCADQVEPFDQRFSDCECVPGDDCDPTSN